MSPIYTLFVTYFSLKTMPKKELIRQDQMVVIQNAITHEMETAKVTMIVQKDVPKYKNEPFTIVFQASNWILGRDVSAAACKVLLTMCGCVDYGNKIGKTQQEIAEHLGYSKRQIYRAYEELEKAYVITREKNPHDSRMNDWYVNAYQSWKGTIKDRQKRISKTDPNQLILFQEPATKSIRPNKDF